MPVFEVGVAAVANKVPTPARPNLTDRASVYQLFHLPEGIDVSHVVPHRDLAAGPARRIQDPVAPFDRNSHRLLQVHVLPGLQRGDCMLLVHEIRTEHDNGIQIGPTQQLKIVGGEIDFRADFRLEVPPVNLAQIRSRDNPHVILRLMRQRRHISAPPQSNYSDLHVISPPPTSERLRSHPTCYTRGFPPSN